VNHVAVFHEGKFGKRLTLCLRGLEQIECGVSAVGEGLDPLSPHAYSHSRIRRSDHSKSTVSSRVLYETVTTATRPGVAA
jgi:hypothetical protein